jgi:hypothetical protein
LQVKLFACGGRPARERSKYLQNGLHSRISSDAIFALVIARTGSAAAGSFITGKQIARNTLTGNSLPGTQSGIVNSVSVKAKGSPPTTFYFGQ